MMSLESILEWERGAHDVISGGKLARVTRVIRKHNDIFHLVAEVP